MSDPDKVVRRVGAPTAGAPGWLVPAALAVMLFGLAKAPAIDEEAYLWIGRHLDLLRPYDWTRVWAPYDLDSYSWAHPPLHLYWMRLCTALTDAPAALRVLAGAPWVALFAWSVARFAGRVCHHPGIAAATWLASPIVVLGLQDTWMIDLPAVALLTFAMAAYREGLVDEEPAWFIGSGLALGAAVETKYTMVVVVPVLALHMRRLGPRWQLWAAMLGVVLAVELPLWASYGRFHPLEMFTRRGEIAAGTVGPRALATLVRAALLGLPLALLRADARLFAAGMGLSLVTLLVARPSEMPVTTSTFLVVLGALGGTLLVRATVAALSPAHRRRKGDRGDPLLLGGWFLAVVLGVVLLHNYASARYLLPAAAPGALLLARAAEEVSWGKLLARVSVGVSAVVALALSEADRRFVNAGAEVAAAAVSAVRDAGLPPGRFAGEWSFRGTMEDAGWTRHRPGEVLEPGVAFVAVDNASPGEIPTDDLEPLRRVESPDRFPLRVIDLERGVGLYAETLGPLPFGVGRGPLEGATIYEVQKR